MARLPWCWKDYFDELYLDRTTWKEDRCDSKWYLNVPSCVTSHANTNAEFGDCMY